MTEQLAVWSSRRPWLTLAGWALALVAAIAISAAFLGDALLGDEEVTSDTDSRRADELVSERFADERGSLGRDATEVVIVRSAGATVDQVRFERRVKGIAAQLRRAGATRVSSFYDTGDRRLVSRGRDATVMLVSLGRDAEDDIAGVVDAVQAADGRDGFDAAITGEFTLDADLSTLAEEDLRNGELGFGLPAALIVLLIVFGSVVAGLIPLLLAIASIVVALALTALVGQAFPLSVFATNMLTAMGLALGIDYSLFVLSCYREERLHGRDRSDAIAAIGGTASRAVLFSGIAFTLAMVGLLLVPSTVMRSVAAGAIVVALVSVAAALTLLPALLGLLGDRVNALRIPFFGRGAGREQRPFWSRTVRAVMRRPLTSLVLATGVLLAMAVPVLGLRSGEAGLLVLVFQEGMGNELLGFPQVDTIESWVPLFLFGVLFGLSMDYHVFLLSRIRERFRQTGNWYLPRWLHWLPDVHVEGAQAARARTSNRTVAPASTGSRRFDPGGLGGQRG